MKDKNRNSGADKAETRQQKPASEMTITELKALIADKRTENGKAKAADNGKAKLAKLRTYTIRQRAWAEAQTAKAIASEAKAEAAETKLREYESKLGVEPMDQAAIDATLAELIATGRVKQVSSADVAEVEPNEADDAAEATKVEAA